MGARGKGRAGGAGKAAAARPPDLSIDEEKMAPAPQKDELPTPPTFMPRQGQKVRRGRGPGLRRRRAGAPRARPRRLRSMRRSVGPLAESGTGSDLPGQPVSMSSQELAEEIANVEQQAQDDSKVGVYRVPPLSLLTRDPGTNASIGREEVIASSAKIIETLHSFGVEATLLGTSRGPAVTRYELTPAAGVKISKITNLADDIALSLAAVGVRIEAPIPGKAAIGIEVPNKTVSTVYLRSILESDQFRRASSPLTFCLGRDIAGQCVVGDISRMPHLLIAGTDRLGQVGVHQLADYQHCSIRRRPNEVQACAGRPQGGRAGCVQRHSAPADPRRHRPQKGGRARCSGRWAK